MRLVPVLAAAGFDDGRYRGLATTWLAVSAWMSISSRKAYFSRSTRTVPSPRRRAY